MQTFAHPSDAIHKIWSRLASLPQRYSSLRNSVKNFVVNSMYVMHVWTNIQTKRRKLNTPQHNAEGIIMNASKPEIMMLNSYPHGRIFNLHLTTTYILYPDSVITARTWKFRPSPKKCNYPQIWRELLLDSKVSKRYRWSGKQYMPRSDSSEYLGWLCNFTEQENDPC